MTKQEILEIFKFFYEGNLVPISFGLLVVYFIFRKKINFIKYKFLSDTFVIAFFIFSIDIALFPHRYFNLIKNLYLRLRVTFPIKFPNNYMGIVFLGSPI